MSAGCFFVVDLSIPLIASHTKRMEHSRGRAHKAPCEIIFLKVNLFYFLLVEISLHRAKLKIDANMLICKRLRERERGDVIRAAMIESPRDKVAEKVFFHER